MTDSGLQLDSFEGAQQTPGVRWLPYRLQDEVALPTDDVTNEKVLEILILCAVSSVLNRSFCFLEKSFTHIAM